MLLPSSVPPKGQLTIEKGNDDVLALLYALASSPEDIEVLLLSIAFGNVNVQKFVSVDPSASVHVVLTVPIAVFAMLFPCSMSSRRRYAGVKSMADPKASKH